MRTQDSIAKRYGLFSFERNYLVSSPLLLSFSFLFFPSSFSLRRKGREWDASRPSWVGPYCALNISFLANYQGLFPNLLSSRLSNKKSHGLHIYPSLLSFSLLLPINPWTIFNASIPLYTASVPCKFGFVSLWFPITLFTVNLPRYVIMNRPVKEVSSYGKPVVANLSPWALSKLSFPFSQCKEDQFGAFHVIMT